MKKKKEPIYLLDPKLKWKALKIEWPSLAWDAPSLGRDGMQDSMTW